MNNLLSFSLPDPNNNPVDVGKFIKGNAPIGGLSPLGENIAQSFVTLAIVFAIIIALFMLVFSGIQWIQSGGDKQKVEAARHRITYTIIGLLVIFFAWFVVNTLGQVFGINLLQRQVDQYCQVDTPLTKNADGSYSDSAGQCTCNPATTNWNSGTSTCDSK